MGSESTVISRSVHVRWKDYRASQMRDNPICSAWSKLESLSPHHSSTRERRPLTRDKREFGSYRAMLVQLQTNGGIVDRMGYIPARTAFAGITS